MRFALSIGFTLAAFLVLASLSYWQGQRLVWKNNLQAEIISRGALAPLVVRGAADLREVSEATHHYRRAIIYGKFAPQKLYWFTQINNKPPHFNPADKVGYHLLQPFTLQDGTTLAIDRGFIPARLKDKAADALTQNKIEVILRWADPRSIFTPADNLAANIIYNRDLKTIATHWRMPIAAPLGEVATQNNKFPLGGQTRITLRNKHFGYMLTWGGLALVLVIISILWHIRTAKER